ncbi:acyl-CoA dehydrogenase [Arthrobacter sp. NEB 688]|uniref:acyl-CoA dehydrogenase n=1 Tax=Arthrobacter sp. NEB 688 TaxID=904039 RepID=UPI001567402B|nr:acyl-CoA dehydrogenase [Arthrobacter sp. NEB 688]QKE82864.1 acyl-CoA dehydrogenase [Arthrobacter sp. NEB 688]
MAARVHTTWRAQEWRREDLEVAAGDVLDGLAVARREAGVAERLAADPWRYLSTLATLGSLDLTVARAAEPHLDAVAVLAQAGHPDLSSLGVDAASTFGVYAARAPGAVLVSRTAADGTTRVDGTKAWCSLSTTVSHALVTVDAGARPGLHAVPLRHPGVVHDDGRWVPRGLAAVRTGSMTLTDVPTVAVGEGDWYLERPGFAWGGIGVAAVWFGAAAAVAGRLVDAARRRPPDQVALLHLGAVDRLLHGALLSLRDAARAIGDGSADGRAGALLAARVRAVVADAAEEVLRAVGHGLGPAPLTADDEHAGRVADLTVYLRQHHAERDLAALGALVLDGEETR